MPTNDHTTNRSPLARGQDEALMGTREGEFWAMESVRGGLSPLAQSSKVVT